MKVEILSVSDFDDIVELVDFGNAGTATDKALNGYQVSFAVVATNDAGEKKEFNIEYQNTERNNGLMAYNGYEMSTARSYGCDSDESPELEKFLDYDENCFDEMDEIANSWAKAKYESLIEDV